MLCIIINNFPQLFIFRGFSTKQGVQARVRLITSSLLVYRIRCRRSRFRQGDTVTILFFQLVQFGDGGNLVIFIQADELYTLGGPTLFTDAIDRHPYGEAALTGDHEVFLFRHV